MASQEVDGSVMGFLKNMVRYISNKSNQRIIDASIADASIDKVIPGSVEMCV